MHLAFTYIQIIHNHGVLSGWNTFNNFNWEKGTICHCIFKCDKMESMMSLIRNSVRLVSDLLENKGMRKWTIISTNLP